MENVEEEFLPGVLDDVLPSFGSGDLEVYFKQENYLEIGCLQEQNAHTDLCFHLPQEEVMSNLQFPLDIPDSTEVHHIVPCPTSIFPARDNFPGIYEFDIEMKKASGDKAKWEFSDSLNKLFVVMQCKVPLKIKWNRGEYGLFVRALPVFLDQNFFAEPVIRCAGHTYYMEKSNEGFQYVNHVIRCEHSHASYETNLESKRLSVVAPLDYPQPGSDGTIIVYSFMCKNSCTVGMNRRSTGIIFTLERKSGEVVGRKMINIRICSCPHRDRIKEESDKTPVKAAQDKTDPAPNEEQVKFIPVVKKPVKRLSKDVVCFQVHLPKRIVRSVAKMLQAAITLGRENDLTPEDAAAFEECNKYIIN